MKDAPNPARRILGELGMLVVWMVAGTGLLVGVLAILSVLCPLLAVLLLAPASWVGWTFHSLGAMFLSIPILYGGVPWLLWNLSKLRHRAPGIPQRIPGTVTLSCPCGVRLRFRSGDGGRHAVCPRCVQPLRILLPKNDSSMESGTPDRGVGASDGRRGPCFPGPAKLHDAHGFLRGPSDPTSTSDGLSVRVRKKTANSRSERPISCRVSGTVLAPITCVGR